MKNIIILLACIACLVGCGADNDLHPETSHKIVVIDSCEYLMVSRRPYAGDFSLTHKGNCKYCIERNAKYIITDGDGVPATGIGGWDNPTPMTKINGSNFTGTPVYTIAVDSLGNIIDTPTGKVQLNRY